MEEFLDTSEEEEVLGRPASEAMRDESLQWAMMVFTAIDENNDQIISENELGKAHALITAYGNGMADLAHGGQMEGIDANHNGKVDKDEWLAYMAAVEQTIGTRKFVSSCERCVDILNRSHGETDAHVFAPGKIKDASVFVGGRNVPADTPIVPTVPRHPSSGRPQPKVSGKVCAAGRAAYLISATCATIRAGTRLKISAPRKSSCRSKPATLVATVTVADDDT